MLLPKKLKYRKHMKGRSFGFTRGGMASGAFLAFGQYGLKALAGGWVSARQIEAARRAMTRFIAREGKIWIRVFPDKPITSKGVESAMGGGKGDVDHFVSAVKAGRILFEMDGVPKIKAKEALRLASFKLNVPTKFVSRDVEGL